MHDDGHDGKACCFHSSFGDLLQPMDYYHNHNQCNQVTVQCPELFHYFEGYSGYSHGLVLKRVWLLLPVVYRRVLPFDIAVRASVSVQFVLDCGGDDGVAVVHRRHRLICVLQFFLCLSNSLDFGLRVLPQPDQDLMKNGQDQTLTISL